MKLVIPQRERCDCGRLVTDHHWLCNKCHAEKQQAEFWKGRMKIVKQDLKRRKKEKAKNEKTNNEIR